MISKRRSALGYLLLLVGTTVLFSVIGIGESLPLGKILLWLLGGIALIALLGAIGYGMRSYRRQASTPRNWRAHTGTILGALAVVAFVGIFGWQVYVRLQENKREEAAARQKAHAVALGREILKRRIQKNGVALPSKETTFVHTARLGDSTIFVVPKDARDMYYCIRARAVDPRKSYVFESDSSRVQEGPLSRPHKIGGLIGHFRLEPDGSQETEVRVWSYPLNRGECKGPTQKPA